MFLDVDNIASGDFPEQIEQAIKGCNDFLLILSPGMLDRCVDEEDWVRHEITLAEQCGKNIIGVSLPGFVMPEPNTLPEPLRDIPEKQVFIWSHEYRNASIDKIVNNMVSSKRKKKRKRRGAVWVLLLLAVVATGAVVLMKLNTPPDPIELEKQARILEAKAYNDTFATIVMKGDSLLRLASTPSETNEFAAFKGAIDEYGEALQLQQAHADMVADTIGLTARFDSLMDLRKQWFERELDVAAKFLSVEQYEFAKYRYENAKALAVDEEWQRLEAVGGKIPK